MTRYNYLIAANPDLTPKWNASLRDRLNDGCNVLIPPNGEPGGCRKDSHTGVAPDTNNRRRAAYLMTEPLRLSFFLMEASYSGLTPGTITLKGI